MHYIGSELDVFAHATRWKLYVRNVLRPFVRGAVLEVGAGKGSFTTALAGLPHSSWSCLEPDTNLAGQIRERQTANEISANVDVIIGTLNNLSKDRLFDTILYLDVLEHIRDDGAEVQRATAHLAQGGRIIILSPAFPALYSPFDAAIGHYRRYTRRSLELIRSNRLRSEASFYLDTAGALLSLANRLLLRSAKPTVKQILFWDRVIIRWSPAIDSIFGWLFGRSVVVVWRAE